MPVKPECLEEPENTLTLRVVRATRSTSGVWSVLLAVAGNVTLDGKRRLSIDREFSATAQQIGRRQRTPEVTP